MSTRCQFAVFPEGFTPRAQLTAAEIRERATALCYRHHDGYPEGAGADLKRHFDAFVKQRGYDDEYLAARLLGWQMEESEKSLNECEWNKGKVRPRDVLGYGICRQIHGDIEFFYAVTKAGVFTYKPVDGDTDKFEALA